MPPTQIGQTSWKMTISPTGTTLPETGQLIG